MKVVRTCSCGNTYLRFDDKGEDVGWHCDRCGSYWGTTDEEDRLWYRAYKEGAKSCQKEVDAYRQLKRTLSSMLGLDRTL